MYLDLCFRYTSQGFRYEAEFVSNLKVRKEGRYRTREEKRKEENKKERYLPLFDIFHKGNYHKIGVSKYTFI